MNFLMNTITLNYLKLLAIILGSLITGSIFTQVYISITTPKIQPVLDSTRCPTLPASPKKKDPLQGWESRRYNDGKRY